MPTPSQHQRKWSPAESDYLRHMVWRGESLSEIAKRLRRSEGAVRRKMRQIERSKEPEPVA